MRISASVLFVSLTFGLIVSAADSKSMLTELGTALRNARSSHNEQQLKVACSLKLGELVGLSKKSILDALGNPDLNEDVVSRDSAPFSLLHYYLRPDSTAITFTVGADNVVKSVSCT